jgi:methionyl-tRNA synthetase
VKNVLAAREAGASVQAFVDANAARFAELTAALATTPDAFVRTSSPDHRRAVRLEPFAPIAAGRIAGALAEPEVRAIEPLFPRLRT